MPSLNAKAIVINLDRKHQYVSEGRDSNSEALSLFLFLNTRRLKDKDVKRSKYFIRIQAFQFSNDP